MPNTGALGSPPQPAPAGAMSPLSSTTAGLLASPSWSSQTSGYLAGGYGAQSAGPNLSAALGSAQMAEQPSQLGVATAEAQASGGFDMANALLGYEGLGLQSQGLAQSASTASTQQGLEEAQFGVQQGQFGEESQKAALSNALAVSGQQRQGAITGTMNTQGYKEQQAAQGQEYGWQQADIFRNQQLSQLGQQSEEAGFAGQEAQIANQRQQLGLAAQGQGVSEQQAIAQLGFGLNQLGSQASPEQFLQSIAGAQGQMSTNLAAFGSQAALTGGLGPNFLGG